MAIPVGNPDSKLWQPDPMDLYHAKQAYLCYAAGVAILHDPGQVQDLHNVDLSKEGSRTQVLAHSQTLIWKGLGDVIRYTNPSRSPHRQLAEAEHHHAEALPHIRNVVDRAVESERARLEALNPLFPTLQPLPLEATTYNYIAHGRRDRVTIAQTMDLLTVSGLFGEDAGQLTFQRRRPSSAAHQ